MLSSSTRRSQWPRIAAVTVALVLVLVLLVQVMASTLPVGADYYKIYRPVAENVINGKTRLYDDHSRGFFNTPWTVILLLPLPALSIRTGQAVLTLASLVALVLSIYLISTTTRRLSAWAVMLALMNLHTLDVIVPGQIDAIILLGITLGYWAVRRHRPWWLALAFWILSMKPPNVILVALLYLYAIRHWSRADQGRAVSLTLGSLLLSFLVLGADWPLRYRDNYRAEAPIETLAITIWRGAAKLGLPQAPLIILAVGCTLAFVWLVLRVGINEWTLSIALATNLLFAPYVTGSHYVYLVPAFLYVTRAKPGLTLPIYLLTLTPLLRLQWGYGAAPVGIVYPLALLIAAWWLALRLRQTAPPTPA
jgi:hypothetical protein